MTFRAMVPGGLLIFAQNPAGPDGILITSGRGTGVQLIAAPILAPGS